jgi:hypothetical protein
MDIGKSTAAAAVLLSALPLVSLAQTTPSARTEAKSDATPVTLVGCLQKETDYRRTHDLGKGGAVGTGAGAGNEYVLINAWRGTAARADADCSFQGTTEAYELTGTRERDLGRLVGRVVRIDGILKKAETRVDASGQAQPTGGVDPLRRDLRLFEVNVTSFQEVTPASAAAVPAAQAPAREAAQAPPQGDRPAAQAPERQIAAATPTPEQLPATASPLPLTGLLGLLSFGAALGIKSLRRR